MNIEKTNGIIHCAALIIVYQNKLILVKRTSLPYGLALFRAERKEESEDLSQAAVERVNERIGLEFEIIETLGIRNDLAWNKGVRYSATLFLGKASGDIRDEEKAKGVMSWAEIERSERQMLPGHYALLNSFWGEIKKISDR